jgi:hypothetical protein
MTKDEIIEMARQAGINYREFSDEFATGNGDGVEIEQMEAFAKLVADKKHQELYRLAEEASMRGDARETRQNILYAIRGEA